MFKTYFNNIISKYPINENNWIHTHYSTGDNKSNFKDVVKQLKKYIQNLTDDITKQREILEQAKSKFNDENYIPNNSNDDADKFILKLVELLDAKSKEISGDDNIANAYSKDPKIFTKRPRLFSKFYKYVIEDIIDKILDEINISKSDEINTSDLDENSPLNTNVQKLLQLIKQLNSGESENNYVLQVIKLIKQLNSGDDNIEGDTEIDNGSWKLICFKKNSPSHNNKERQYDLYRLANEKLMTQLKETLGIDYFALNYTTKQPTELERYLGNVKPMLQDCNCQIMAFAENHKPLPQFCGQSGITHVYLQKTNDKNIFELIPGSFPVFKEPSKTYTNEQFIQTIDNTLRNSDDQTKQLIEQCSIYYNKVLEVVYNDLKMVKNTANYNLADFVVTQFVTNNDQLTSKIKNVFNDLLASTAKPIIAKIQQEIQNNPNQQQSNQNEQQLLAQFETQFKQQLPTNRTYNTLKQELQKT